MHNCGPLPYCAVGCTRLQRFVGGLGTLMRYVGVVGWIRSVSIGGVAPRPFQNDRRHCKLGVLLCYLKAVRGNFLETSESWRRVQGQLDQTVRLSALGEAVAAIAHELNDPIACIVGRTQLILEQCRGGCNKDDLETVLNQAQRAAQLVRDILSFAGRWRAEKRPVDLISVLDRVLALKSSDLRASNVQVETRLSCGMRRAVVDERQMEAVFINLVTNAEQAMVETNGGGHILIRARQRGDRVQVSFRDDGPGIPVNRLTAVFEAFYTTKRWGQGMGLGLSICKGLVQEQGGRIWAESAEGEGATFFIEVPAYGG